MKAPKPQLSTSIALRLIKNLFCSFALALAIVCVEQAVAENVRVSRQVKRPDVHSAGLTLGGTVRAIAVAPNGDVYAGGSFQNGAGNSAIDYIARWNGTRWSPLGMGLSGGDDYVIAAKGVHALAFNDSKLYVGGNFWSSGDGTPLYNFARWDINTNTWEPLNYSCPTLGPAGCGPGLYSDYVFALAKPLSGAGIFVGGHFHPFDTVSTLSGVAFYTGSEWNSVGTRFHNDRVSSFYVESSSGRRFAGDEKPYLWNGSDWEDLWQGRSNWSYSVNDIEGASGNTYFAGSFRLQVGTQGTGQPIYANGFAKWDGANWSKLGTSDPFGGYYSYGNVNAIGISGSNIYVGGEFSDDRSGQYANRFARWNGTAWNDAGAYLSSTGGDVYAIAVSGDQVYVGGSFSNAGNIGDADYIARFNGTSWSAMVNPTPTPTITPTPAPATPTPVATPRPPVAQAIGASGQKGTRIKLRYRVLYTGPGTSETIWVLKGRRLIATIRGSFGPSKPGVTYYLLLNSTNLLRGPYRYCVVALDNYARISNRSCADLIVR